MALKTVLKYPLILGCGPAVMIGSFAERGMGSVAGNLLWMGPLKFKQEEMLIPHLLGMICGIPANTLGAIIIPRIGVWKAIFFGCTTGCFLGFATQAWPVFWM